MEDQGDGAPVAPRKLDLLRGNALAGGEHEPTVRRPLQECANKLSEELARLGVESMDPEWRSEEQAAERSPIGMHIVPADVVELFGDKQDYRGRARGMERLKASIVAASSHELLQETLEEFIAFLGTLLDDDHFKVSHGALELLGILVAKLGSDSETYLQPIVAALSKVLGDSLWVTKRQSMKTFISLMTWISPTAVMNLLLNNLNEKTYQVRKEVLNIVIAALLTFPSRDFDLVLLCDVIAPFLGDPKRKVRHAALETFAVLASSMDANALKVLHGVVEKVQQDADGVSAAVQARLARRRLPKVSSTGLVEYATCLTSSSSSAAENRSAQSWCGPDADWVALVGGPSSARSSRSESGMGVSAGDGLNYPDGMDRLSSKRVVSAGHLNCHFPWEEHHNGSPSTELMSPASKSSSTTQLSWVSRSSSDRSLFSGRDGNWQTVEEEVIPLTPAMGECITPVVCHRGEGGDLPSVRQKSARAHSTMSTEYFVRPVFTSAMGLRADTEDTPPCKESTTLKKIPIYSQHRSSKESSKGKELILPMSPEHLPGKTLAKCFVRGNEPQGSEEFKNGSNSNVSTKVDVCALKGKSIDIDPSTVRSSALSVQRTRNVCHAITTTTTASVTTTHNASRKSDSPLKVLALYGDGFHDDSTSKSKCVDAEIITIPRKIATKKTPRTPARTFTCKDEHSSIHTLNKSVSPHSSEFEYSSRDVKPLPSPEYALAQMKETIPEDDWEKKIQNLVILRCLLLFHHELLLPCLPDIISFAVLEVNNLRSTVSRMAIVCLGEAFQSLKKNMDSELDVTVNVLLHKSGESSHFIREEVNRSLELMIANITATRALGALAKCGVQHRNPAVRRCTAQHMSALVFRLGPDRLLTGIKDVTDRVLSAASVFTRDSLAETRYYGKQMIDVMMRHQEFNKIVEKCVPSREAGYILETVNTLKCKGLGKFPSESSSQPFLLYTKNSDTTSGSRETRLTLRQQMGHPVSSRVLRENAEQLKTLTDLLESKDFRERIEGIKRIVDCCSGQPVFVSANLMKIFDAFMPRFQDSNSKVTLAALESMQKIIPQMKETLHQLIHPIVSAVINNNVNSKNSTIYIATISVLDSLILHLDIVKPVYSRNPQTIEKHVHPVLWKLQHVMTGYSGIPRGSKNLRTAAIKLARSLEDATGGDTGITHPFCHTHNPKHTQ
uniref:TOG domain-containing protein n=1 Tax=Eptatretus burgeri TaxID=7764 RepID=A0A8C4NE27_EPTBU